MTAKQIGNLESNLFQTSGEPKTLAERLRGERIISWERAPRALWIPIGYILYFIGKYFLTKSLTEDSTARAKNSFITK